LTKISELVWRCVARICSNPMVCDFLIRLARRRPYLHIGEYMRRYWLLPMSWNLPFTIRVHHILLPDADPYLHDHPWNWRTIILRGWYFEEDVFGLKHRRLEGFTGGNTAETFHRIDRVSPGGVWTLFIMGRRRNAWGFMHCDPARKTYYQEYVSVNSRGELVEPVE
jgi:hypothetical protein